MSTETTTAPPAPETASDHRPEPWYWEAGSEHCPHGPKPSDAASDEELETWEVRHPLSDEGPICLDAPMGDHCPECSADCNDPVPWSACTVRTHAKTKPGTTPTPEAHEPIEVWVGTGECHERECDDYYDDNGDEIPGKDRCSHIGTEVICGGCSTLDADGYYAPSVPWAGPHTAAAALAAPTESGAR